MSGELEAAGAAITAGAAAAAIEGKEGRGAAHSGLCPNCAAKVEGRFCASCGQPAHISRSLGHIVEETLHSLFHFDTKAWRTLPMLAFRPGTLTANYIHGQRARYIGPIALFLFTVFLMFFVFALSGGAQIGMNAAPKSAAEQAARLNEARVNLAEAEADLAEARKNLEAAANGPGAEAAQAAVAGVEEAVKRARAGVAAAEASRGDRAERFARLKAARLQLDANEAQARAEDDAEDLQQIAIAKAILDGALARGEEGADGVVATVDSEGGVDVSVNPLAGEGGMTGIFEQIKLANREGKIKVNTGNPAWDKKIKAKLENPELAWYKIQNAAYKFSFLLVPLSLPFLWLLFFWKRGVTGFDHAVFALYSLSFASMLLILASLLTFAPSAVGETIGGLLVLSVPAHMFFQLKGAYQLGWFSALWRTAFLLVFAAICLALFLGLIFVLGLMG
jgi:hypothetical protein